MDQAILAEARTPENRKFPGGARSPDSRARRRAQVPAGSTVPGASGSRSRQAKLRQSSGTPESGCLTRNGAVVFPDRGGINRNPSYSPSPVPSRGTRRFPLLAAVFHADRYQARSIAIFRKRVLYGAISQCSSAIRRDLGMQLPDIIQIIDLAHFSPTSPGNGASRDHPQYEERTRAPG